MGFSARQLRDDKMSNLIGRVELRAAILNDFTDKMDPKDEKQKKERRRLTRELRYLCFLLKREKPRRAPEASREPIRWKRPRR